MASGGRTQPLQRPKLPCGGRPLCLILATTVIAGCAFNPFARQQPISDHGAARPPSFQQSPTSLTEQASQTLSQAEQCVTQARATQTSWSSAVEKLGRANQAAKSFDSDATIVFSQEVINICLRSTAQAKLPPVSW